MAANTQLRTYLDQMGYTAGTKVPQHILVDLIDYVPNLYNVDLPPTPDEVFFNRSFIQGKVKDKGDYSKSSVILSDKVTAKEGDPYFVESLVSPSAAIGLSQIIDEEGNKKYVVIFKNKPDVIGYATIGGTLGIVNPKLGPLTPTQRFSAYLEALRREFFEEAGLSVNSTKLIDAPQLNARLDHHCAFYLVKSSQIGEQRIEDSDLSVLVVDFETAVRALTSCLAIDDFVVKYFRFYLKEIKAFFGEN